MNSSRLYAVALILVECVTLAVMSEAIGFAIVVGLIACVGVTGKITFSFTPRKIETILALMLVALVAKWFIAPPAIPWVSGHLTYNSGYAISQFILLVQVLVLFVSSSNPILLGVPFLGAAVMAFAGNRISFGHDWHTRFFGISSIIFTSLIALYAMTLTSKGTPTRRESRNSILVARSVVLGLVVLLSLGSASLLVSAEEDLIRLASWMFLDTPITTPIGWTNSSSLGSISILKSDSEKQTLLRIYSDHPPGYLKGKTYSRFQNNHWSNPTSERKLLEPISGNSKITTDHALNSNLFQIEKDPGRDQETMEVWKDESTGTTIFVPSTASFLMADTDHLHLDPVGNIESDPKEELTDYTVFVSQEFRPASDNEAEYLEIPDDVDSAVAELAKNLFEGCNSVSEKVERMESFFQENFSYSLNVQIPPGVDPLSHFLVSKPSAHCEYFASGATILLRLGGVPARYVTGFVVQEKNRFGGYWIGTNEDAHAWAEAYDPDNGWTLVETTPPEGIPSVGERGRFEQLTSYVVYLVTTMPTAIWKRVSGWIAQLGWGIGERKTLIGVGIVVVFITGLLLAVWRLRRRLGRKVKVESEDPIVVALQSARSKVDQILKRQGWERKPSETILQFATRIEVDRQSAKSVQSAAEWYRDYCRIRYGNTRNESTVESLKERAITL